MVDENPNLSITRSLDKAFSMAGARIGCLVAGDHFLEVLSEFHTFPSRMGFSAALEAMKTQATLQTTLEK
ncbi:hypothetical protein AKJ37_01465 [candidate division MSBL1 archaeon SCGC-AAA259I09]|uniref:Aminotransferase class I/classII large domain-containing protein n=2 Tax=candidate division MSBL1 TaxID=215777 RepID=A0A133UTC0_9EURY|nr:hypothetical protein AKJ38_01130 [candidate division MSBL1 archaeon SCGC-AAA259I14]KXA98054.1 hypothetical protein AKJ37_01465 [candidate division MSBL1 archaeon SCGC-AAA259I09]